MTDQPTPTLAPAEVAVPAAAPAVEPVAPTPSATEFDWRSLLTDEQRVDPTIQRFKDPSSLAKSYLELNRTLGGDARSQLVKLPDGTADDAAWQDYYNRVRPEKPGNYEFKAELPEGMQVDGSLQEAFRDAAHKHGLTKRQAESIFADVLELQTKQFSTATAEAEKNLFQLNQQLKQEWGAAYEHKMDNINNALDKYTTPELIDLLHATGLNTHPAMARFLDAVVKDLGEGTVAVKNNGATGEAVLTPGEAAAMIAQLQSDKEFMQAYLTKQHPGHEVAMAKMSNLYKLRAGKK